MTGLINLFSARQVKNPRTCIDRLKKKRPHIDGFLKHVDIWTGFFKPANASAGKKIQHCDIQVKFTCGV